MKFARSGRNAAKVRAKRLKSGDIALQHGETLFRISPSEYAAITFGSASANEHALYGSKLVGADAEKTVLAVFPTVKEAQNAHRAVTAAYAGFGRGGWWRWPAGVLGLFVAANVLFSQPSQALPTVYPDVQQGAVGSARAAPAAALPGQFNPNEPTLEELAAGNYRPNLKVQVPDVKAPELSCATQ
ncbi:hypothetical protein [Methylibium petroleiphilum]|uniref:Uncharacterized protein n=1 Tax=Methylibium petroleiphilum (strain ATCC BAA-1232 / LMG 22953 / PM1) TaxID=420662 RepID=A2SMP8_METPP|nr:hypothetical protein [Methylibium petroleiphilum]ABM96837.1 hypothetical protein Mpe_B0058 [Methylibium petroleiphilum PM1]